MDICLTVKGKLYSTHLYNPNSHIANNKINKVHLKFLQSLYDDNDSTFKELLDKEGTFTVHETNIHKLLIEMFKVKNNKGPPLLKEIFKKMEYTGPTPKNRKDFSRPNINSKIWRKIIRSLWN